jgi:hypothetical protein
VAAIVNGLPDAPAQRPDADKRRDRLLEDSGLAPRPDEDRDEYSPAAGRGCANSTLKGFVRGINPIGWMADVMYVPHRENQSHGSSLGATRIRSRARCFAYQPMVESYAHERTRSTRWWYSRGRGLRTDPVADGMLL